MNLQNVYVCKSVNVCIYLTRNVFYDLAVSTIESSAPGGNVNWDLKKNFTIKRSPLKSVCYIEVLLGEFDGHSTRS